MIVLAKPMIHWRYQIPDTFTIVPDSYMAIKNEGDGMTKHERRINLMHQLDRLHTQTANTMPYADGPMLAQLEDIEAMAIDMRQQAGSSEGES